MDKWKCNPGGKWRRSRSSAGGRRRGSEGLRGVQDVGARVPAACLPASWQGGVNNPNNNHGAISKNNAVLQSSKLFILKFDTNHLTCQQRSRQFYVTPPCHRPVSKITNNHHWIKCNSKITTSYSNLYTTPWPWPPWPSTLSMICLKSQTRLLRSCFAMCPRSLYIHSHRTQLVFYY